MTPNWLRRETRAMASDRTDTASDKTLRMKERRSDASDDRSCSRISSLCDSRVRMTCAKSGSRPSGARRKASTSVRGRSRRPPRESMAVLAFSVATLAIVALGAVTGSVFALVYGAVLSVFWLTCSLIFLLLGRGRKG